MTEKFAFVNWGFKPTIGASGWVFCSSQTMYWDDMRGRDLYPPHVTVYNLKDLKEQIVETILDEIHEWFYERDGWDSTTDMEAFNVPFDITLNNGVDVVFIGIPNDLGFYFPNAQNAEDWEEGFGEKAIRTHRGHQFDFYTGNWFKNKLKPYLKEWVKNIDEDINFYTTSQEKFEYKSQLKVLVIDQHDDWERRIITLTVSSIRD